MATASTINVGSGTSIITFDVTSNPSNPIIRFSTPNEYLAIGDPSLGLGPNQIRVPSNTGSSRVATVNIGTMTTANSEYNGTASATSAYTIIQEAAPEYWQFYYSGPPMVYRNNVTDYTIYINIDIDAPKLYEGDEEIGRNSLTIPSMSTASSAEFIAKLCKIKSEYDSVDIYISVYGDRDYSFMLNSPTLGISTGLHGATLKRTIYKDALLREIMEEPIDVTINYYGN